VDIEASMSTDEGVSADITVSLNGNAAAYPVSIPYTFGGSATEGDDFSTLSGTISLESGTEASLTVTTFEDSIYEGDETLTITLGTPTNAVAGTKIEHTLTIVEANLAPSLALTISQGGETVTSVVLSNGDVTITVALTDLNPNDSHLFDWSGTDNSLVEIETSPTTTFTFDPSGLLEGLYSISVTAEDDGAPVMKGSAISSIRILSEEPELSSELDTDGDGISDLAEGYNDADEDRIPDYLDDNTVTTQLPVSEDAGSIQTEAGLSIRLGETAFAEGQGNASLTEAQIAANISAGGLTDTSYNYPLGLVDFEIIGVHPGESTTLVIPLEGAIPANAVYRKLFPNTGWFDFVEDANNSIASTGSTVGACPAPGSDAYTPGLTVGSVCIELTIEDGGDNDTDNSVNGVVADPGGIAVVPAKASSGSSGGGAADIWSLGLLGLIGGLFGFRRKK